MIVVWIGLLIVAATILGVWLARDRGGRRRPDKRDPGGDGLIETRFDYGDGGGDGGGGD